MRRLLLSAALFAAALPLAARAESFDPRLEETVRCYDAASVYAQLFVVTNRSDKAHRLMGYAAELKARAYAIGTKDGKSHDEVRSEFADDDSFYVHRFFIFGPVGMALTEFGGGEIAACNLGKVIK